MEFIKKELCRLERCYAVNELTLNGVRWALAATEDPGPCWAFSGKSFENRMKIWDGPGGTMTFVPLSGTDGEFLSIEKFYRIYQWEEAGISWAWPENGSFRLKSLLTLPYIHRFDVLETPAGSFFIGCTLAVKKDSVSDWSTPGSIYVGRVDKAAREIRDLRVLKGDVYKNHGYLRTGAPSAPAALIGSREGILRVTPPMSPEGDWQTERFAGFPVSDMALCDIDGDGEEELAVIEPFHGCKFRIYKKNAAGWKRVFEHPETCEFYHVIWGGTLNGTPAFIAGGRRGTRSLSVITCSGGEYRVQTLDSGQGPSNVHVMHRAEGDVIIAANMEVGEVAAYFVK